MKNGVNKFRLRFISIYSVYLVNISRLFYFISLFNDNFATMSFLFHFRGPVRSSGSPSMSVPMCHFCKLRNGLGRMGPGFGFEHRRWHFSTNVRMWNFIEVHAFSHSVLNYPSLGVGPGSISLEPGRLTR